MIKAHYNPITGQSFKIVHDTREIVAKSVAKATIEKIRKQKTSNMHRANCKHK